MNKLWALLLGYCALLPPPVAAAADNLHFPARWLPSLA